MDSNRRSNIAVGIVLILIGVVFLVTRLVPGLQIDLSWPWIVIGVGAALLVIGALTGVPDLAVPGCIVGGIGGILYYQNATGNWGSWSYMWTLIPGFVGVGVLLAALLGSRGAHAYREALRSILTSLVLFLVFGSFFGAFSFLGNYWPLLLVGAGVIILVLGVIPRKK